MPLNNDERRLAALIATWRDRLVDDLRLFVGIPTGLDHRAGLDRMRSLLCQRLTRLGATVETIPAGSRPTWLHGSPVAGMGPPTAIARRWSPRPGATRILLSGHLDTVHDPDPDHPFRELVIAPDGRTATGPGCVDMKGGLVIACAALEALHECGMDACWSFILNSDEETGSYWSEGALRSAAREHQVGLVFEPALPDGSLVTRRPGSGQFMVEARGRSAHVGRDFASGVSAVNALAGAVLRLSEFVDLASGRIVNVGPVVGGHATNVVPDLARAWGNVRFPDAAAGEDLERMIRSVETPEISCPSIRIETSFNRPAKEATPAVMALAEAARSVAHDLGQSMTFGSTGGVCDGNILQAEGLPVIDTLGVRGGGLHTPQEWIDLSSLVDRCALTAILMARLWHSGI
ncbi:MAG: M20/M25/M40 family metallo-hydrolase [Phycisphaeraceae bacterium]|nr:M20/M25/M40 family metallo-hydrolase [Phycisphaerae bacterium]MBX3392404.1 M20/M25/M40 family metallo-hydrolase [Phycisphaeraceae bacterium]